MCTHTSHPKRCLINSVVSSHLLLSIARHFQVYCDQTLTGFKWMGNRQATLEGEGYQPLLTYEEAIGYAVGGVLRDKDGVSALAKMCEIVCELENEGRSLIDYLQEMYVMVNDVFKCMITSKLICGFFTTRNNYVISNSKEYTDQVFKKLRNHGNYLYFSSFSSFSSLSLFCLMTRFKFGPYVIQSIRDLTLGFDSQQASNAFKPVLPVDPSSHMITFEFVNGACLTLRTSGTEPKIKYYLEVTHKEEEECESRSWGKLGD